MLRWEDNIKMYLKEIAFEDVDSIQLVQGKVQWHTLASKVMNLFGCITDAESFHYLSDSQLLKKFVRACLFEENARRELQLEDCIPIRLKP
jgi:hypothetical protein